MRTQVAIIGAGPAGLVLSHFCSPDGHRRRSSSSAATAPMSSSGCAPACWSRAPSTCSRAPAWASGWRAKAGPSRHRPAVRRGSATASRCSELTGGRAITVYGQQEVVKDLIARPRWRPAARSSSRSRRQRCTTSTAERAARPLPARWRDARAATATSSPAATASTASAAPRSRRRAARLRARVSRSPGSASWPQSPPRPTS